MKAILAALLALALGMGCGKKGELTPKAEPESTSGAKPSRPKQTPNAGRKEAANPWEIPISLSLFMAREYAGEGQANALVEIARAQIGAGNKQQAVKTLRQAWVVAQTIEDAPDPDDGPENLKGGSDPDNGPEAPKGGPGSENSSRAYALMMIASVLATAGDVKQALEVIRTIKNEHAKSEVRLHIAQFLSERGDVKQALEVARMIKDDRIRVDHVRSIV